MNPNDQEALRRARQGSGSGAAEKLPASEALCPASEEWEQTFDAVPDWISIHDKQHRIVRLNRAMANRLGKSLQACVGLPCYECVHGLNQPPSHCPHVLTCQDGQPHTAEICADRLGGDFLCRATPLRNRRGELVGSIHVTHDITELKRAAQALRETEEHRRRMNELNEQLSQRVNELAAVNAELESFSYSVSHDLRAPLRQVAGFADLLQETAGDKLDCESAEYLPLIQRAVRRMSQLIDDLLAFSRMGRAELKCATVDLRGLVDEVRHTLQPATAGRDVVWRIHALPTLRGDASMLRQVLVNLLDNALKFTRRCPHTVIEIGCRSDAAGHTFFVRDNGVGFDVRKAEKLFGVFQRFHSAGEFEGTGIGLASVRRIIQRHGGRTWAESAPDRGATFHFSLPAAGSERP
jgi:PAS domain S-box-containing protein